MGKITSIVAGDVLPAPGSAQGAVLLPLGGALTPHEAAHLCQHAEDLGPRGRAVLMKLGERLVQGAKIHGDFAARDWRRERAEELFDAMAYEVAEQVCPSDKQPAPKPAPVKQQYKIGDWVRVTGGRHKGKIVQLSDVWTDGSANFEEDRRLHALLEGGYESWRPVAGELVRIKTLNSNDAFAGRSAWIHEGEVVVYLGTGDKVPALGGPAMKDPSLPPAEIRQYLGRNPVVRRVGRTDNRQPLMLLSTTVLEPYTAEELPGQDGFLSDGKTPWLPKAGQWVKMVAEVKNMLVPHAEVGKVYRVKTTHSSRRKNEPYERCGSLWAAPIFEGFPGDRIVRCVPAEEPKPLRKFPRDGAPPPGIKVRVTKIDPTDERPGHRVGDVVRVGNTGYGCGWVTSCSCRGKQLGVWVCLYNCTIPGMIGTYCECEEVDPATPITPTHQPPAMPRRFPRDGIPPAGMRVRVTAVCDEDNDQRYITPGHTFLAGKGITPHTYLFNRSQWLYVPNDLTGKHCAGAGAWLQLEEVLPA